MTKDELEIETSKAIMEMRNHIAELEAQIEKMKADYDKLLDKKIELEDKISNRIIITTCEQVDICVMKVHTIRR